MAHLKVHWARRRAPMRGSEAARMARHAAGLAVLGVLAVGMAAFPERTAALLNPFRGAFMAVWKGGFEAVGSARGAVRGVGTVFENTARLAQRTRQLEAKVEAAGQDAVKREEERRELIRLRRLLRFRESVGEEATPARVIGGDPASGFTTLVVDSGGTEGIREGQAVAAPAGVVGCVMGVGPDYSTVLWLCDPRSRIAAYVQRSRVVGVLVGTGGGCELRYLSTGDDVQVGDRVLTAGRGSVFPRSILIGTVKELRKDGLLMSAVVAPAVNVRRLEEVLIFSHRTPQ